MSAKHSFLKCIECLIKTYGYKTNAQSYFHFNRTYLKRLYLYKAYWVKIWCFDVKLSVLLYKKP